MSSIWFTFEADEVDNGEDGWWAAEVDALEGAKAIAREYGEVWSGHY
jgi:hypothetical protein